ncbi:DUF2812 domain-containing protein [Ruminococcus sp. 5_1_39BFAA]|uniref:DUF2812 domain-containing protein n=1 Tax=Ruminococcus sp. 5_1_39BFAA TaxID=457412 RepID=UPI003561BE18
MVKFRLYLDKDEETVWLNEMAARGYAMKRFFAGFYWFEECEPGEYTYQVDFGNKLFSVSDDYREFMEDTGVEIVQTWGFWVILRKPASEGGFQLYTDVDSSIEHYSKIRRMFKAVTILELICFMSEGYGAATGSTWAVAFMFLIGAMMLALANAVNKTSRIIAELQERKGEQPKTCRNRDISPLLPCGLLLNSCALLAEESVSHPVKLVIQIIAIIFMLVGVYQTSRSRR